jgi:hypothetical protein
MPGLHNVIFGSGGAALAQIHLLKHLKAVGCPSAHICSHRHALAAGCTDAHRHPALALCQSLESPGTNVLKNRSCVEYSLGL